VPLTGLFFIDRAILSWGVGQFAPGVGSICPRQQDANACITESASRFEAVLWGNEVCGSKLLMPQAYGTRFADGNGQSSRCTLRPQL